jgi:Cilia- and flagella-associated protein HOATZ-like
MTIFDGSRESKLATQFWNSVVLIPPVESTLVCKEIKQRVRTHTLKEGTSKR